MAWAYHRIERQVYYLMLTLMHDAQAFILAQFRRNFLLDTLTFEHTKIQ
jgi:hypothetical protein